MSCRWHDSGSVELYFYGELDARARARFEAHRAGFDACRDALADLETIRRALAGRREHAAPPSGDGDSFMRRLDARLDEASAPRAPRGWNTRVALKIAATIAIATAGVLAGVQIQRWRAERVEPLMNQASVERDARPRPVEGLTTGADQHLERSKLVLLGLAAKDPRHARPNDWRYERHLASTLLADTTQYRLVATEQGRSNLADVLGDLETVLLQASLGNDEDPRALERLQRLIDRRDLLTKIEIMSAEGPARRASIGGAAGRASEGRSRGHE